MARHSHRESFYFHNQLTGFIKKLENYYTTIDLRNESSVTGKIILVDGYMNIELEDVVLYDNRGIEHPFESFFIRARNIRYVHIPLEISIINLVKDLTTIKTIRKVNSKQSFKVKRAKQRQQQLLQELAAGQQEQHNKNS